MAMGYAEMFRLGAKSRYFPIILGVFIMSIASFSEAKGPLSVSKDNPRYFTDPDGNIVYVTGSHTWNNFKDMSKSDPPRPFDYEGYLNFLQKYNHNFIRLWTWELTKYTYEGIAEIDSEAFQGVMNYAKQFPWQRTGPGDALDGKPKFDLSKFDESYFERLRSRVTLAGERGIYVSIMLFEGHGLHSSKPPWRWDGHPFNIQNNINGIDGDPNKDGMGIEIQTLQIPEITKIQEKYVAKVIDTVNDLDNVLYEIVNESGKYSTEWQYYMINFIHNYEKKKPKQHPVGMTFQWAPGDMRGSNANLFNSPADWISPNPEGGYTDNPPTADGSKVILTDTDHLWGIGGNQAWVWKSFCRGMNPLFMDPYLEVKKESKKDGNVVWTDYMSAEPKLDPKWDPIRKSLGYTLSYAKRMDLAKAIPRNDLSSTGYCLANIGKEYLVYAPNGGEVTIDLTDAEGKLIGEWFNPNNGTVTASGIELNKGKVTLKPNFDGDAVLFVIKQN